MIDYRYRQGKMASVQHVLTRAGADITSLLGMKTTPELCRQKCRYIQASSHNQAEVYIRGLGGGASTI